MKAVDLFAGLGGYTEGAEMAGVPVVWAANHWRLAVDAHARNHSKTHHECQDLRQADWTALPNFDLLLASPACQGHSEASQPKRRQYHDAMRATAWAVVDCAEVTRPKGFSVENVPQFVEWTLFPDWLSAMRRLGYTVTQHVLLATEHGGPQRRRRLFITGTLNGSVPVIRPSTNIEPPFEPCLDPQAGGWRPMAECRSQGAINRIRRAQSISGRRCLVQHVTGHPGVPLHEAIRTITTKDQWILVDGEQYRPLTVREYARGMGFRDSYELPTGTRADVVKAIGNAVCPPKARDVVTALADAAN